MQISKNGADHRQHRFYFAFKHLFSHFIKTDNSHYSAVDGQIQIQVLLYQRRTI